MLLRNRPASNGSASRCNFELPSLRNRNTKTGLVVRFSNPGEIACSEVASIRRCTLLPGRPRGFGPRGEDRWPFCPVDVVLRGDIRSWQDWLGAWSMLLAGVLVGTPSSGATGNKGGVVSNFPSDIASPYEMASGPDGALWFTNIANNSIGRITTSGVVTDYSDPSIGGPQGITTGPDGALWFTNEGNNSIGRITTSGVVTNYSDSSIDEPERITAGSDEALWFTNAGNNSIGRITSAGVVTNYTDASIVNPIGITSGPDGALWFVNLGKQVDWAYQYQRRDLQLHRHRHRQPVSDHGGSRRRLGYGARKWLSDRPERCTDLSREQFGLLPGGEVSALVHRVEVDDIGVGLLDPAARGPPDLTGKRGEADRDRYGRRSPLGRTSVFLSFLPVRARRRGAGARQPVQSDVV